MFLIGVLKYKYPNEPIQIIDQFYLVLFYNENLIRGIGEVLQELNFFLELVNHKIIFVFRATKKNFNFLKEGELTKS